MDENEPVAHPRFGLTPFALAKWIKGGGNENHPPWIWLTPWSWRGAEVRLAVLWAVVTALILSVVAPPLLPGITSAVGYLCLRGWRFMFELLGKLT